MKVWNAWARRKFCIFIVDYLHVFTLSERGTHIKHHPTLPMPRARDSVSDMLFYRISINVINKFMASIKKHIPTETYIQLYN